ncbi:CbtB domain-containing protein [Hansschlegelia plantiphila]|uniref:CbtB-domain containing protein n=1 Tax=Hansschlegelia plantiphila TaxID=374655 RepID=A0A9W6IZN4_9HYPH|nr:CbtB domain-containing protein [Hansschlegelia plantiphila]GLK67612.1 hypothetical protein GCM10008179_12500 [Hansschlegelia plantiphila]
MTSVQNATRLTAASSADSAVQVLAAALLGMAVLFGVGFSAMPALHNAAHDARHSVGFPCH